jgi:hypothetical protein
MRWLWRMSSAGMWRHVGLVRTDVAEEPVAFIIRATWISNLGITLASQEVGSSVELGSYLISYVPTVHRRSGWKRQGDGAQCEISQHKRRGQWSSNWGARTSRSTRRNLKEYAKSYYINQSEALILALTKIRPKTELLTCQEQAQSSH